MKHIVSYSGGIGSWAAALRVVEKHGAENTLLVFTDTLIEDEDLYRFVEESVQDLGAEFLRLADGRTPWEVFKAERYLGNSRIDPCSKILKRQLFRNWLESKFKPSEAIIYLGIDWTESHRFDRARPRWEPWKVEAPLCEAPYVMKNDLFDLCRARGMEPPRLYSLGFSHNNCFAGDTRFMTRYSGMRTLADACGEDVQVLGHRGVWREAHIRSFGTQETFAVTLKRYNREHVIRATADHVWFVRRGERSNGVVEKKTFELETGARLQTMAGVRLRHNVRPSPQAIAYGVVFGDGCAPHTETQRSPAHILLAHGLEELKRYFPNNPCIPKEEGLFVTDLPRFYKRPLLTESQSFLYGWLAGYFAADGCIKKDGACMLSSATKANLEFVQAVCAHLGIHTSPIGDSLREGFEGREPSVLYTLPLASVDLREDFFLLERHRKRWLSQLHKKSADWRVVSVAASATVTVYCAVADGQAFTLEHGIHVHNCGGFCVKSGQTQFKLLLETMPERYAEHEQQERELRAFLGKDVSILRRQRDGKRFNLTLEALRLDVEANREVPTDEWGRCGCFSDF